MPRERTDTFHSDFRQRLFLEFGTFSITDWIGHAPRSLLSKKILNLPEAAFDGFPKRGGLLRSRRDSAGANTGKSGCACCSAADPQIPDAFRGAARRVQRWSRMARRLGAISNFDDDNWRPFSTLNPALSASCTGIPMPMNGNTLSTAM